MSNLEQQAWDGEVADLARNLRSALDEVQRDLNGVLERLDRPQEATHDATQLVIDASEVARLVQALHTAHRLRFARPANS